MRKPVALMVIANAMWALNAGAQEPAASSPPPAAVQHAPRVVCAEPMYNFGSVDSSQDVTHAFVLKNEGDLSLEIRNVRASCGCTVASVSRNTVPPGEQAEVTARLSLRGRRGPQHKTVTVESNDPATPNLVLHLEGEATAELEIRPNQVFYGRIATSAAFTNQIEIVVGSPTPVTVTKVTSDSPYFGTVLERTADGKSWRLFVSTKPVLPKGSLRANVRIETDSPRYPQVDLPVSAFVVGEISFSPEEIVMAEDTNAPVIRFVIVRSEAQKPFEIRTVEPPAPGITANVQSIDAGGYRIELRGILADLPLSGKVLRITTSLEGAEEILIPFRVIPKPAEAAAPVAPPPDAPPPQ
jgi:hypothetical protein